MSERHSKGSPGINPLCNPLVRAHHTAGATFQAPRTIKRDTPCFIKLVQDGRTNDQAWFIFATSTDFFLQDDMRFFLVHIELIKA
jgi:hypothetical protein